MAWNTLSNPSKHIDEHGKQSSLEEDSGRTIDTMPAISSHVSPIGQIYSNSEKYQIIIGNLVDNMSPCIIRQKMPYKTNVNIIFMTE